MIKKLKLAAGILLFCTVVCILFGIYQYNSSFKGIRYIQHEELSKADSELGPTEIDASFQVEGTFVSHLPLVVIDTKGEEIVNHKYYDPNWQVFRYEKDVDPYTKITISVIDNENHVNRAEDPPSIQSEGKIKIRGNNSSTKAKAQYRIKLQDEDGTGRALSIMGMEKDSDWILNGTQRDKSYLRNYMAFNLAGQMGHFDYTPDIRYCEVLFRDGNTYHYAGLYTMMEAVGRSLGRLELPVYDPQVKAASYLVRRDRYDPDDLILDTWASTADFGDRNYELLKSGRLGLKYPNPEDVTEETVQYITDDLSALERILYSDDRQVFDLWKDHIDASSFIDYYIINELMGNYDAGLYSTYMYRSSGEKLKIGPVWDFDGCMDNSDNGLSDYRYIDMTYRPWFERLMSDESFVKAVEKRYRQLRRSLLSEASLEEFIDSTTAFLGNAAKRDESRWKHEYENSLNLIQDINTGLIIDRNVSCYEEEIQRIKDYLYEHGRYMDRHIHELEQHIETKAGIGEMSILMAAGIILLFFVTIILVQRKVKL